MDFNVNSGEKMDYNIRRGIRPRRSGGALEGKGLWIGVAFAIVTVITLILLIAPSYFKTKEVTTEVISKENVCSGSGDSVKCEYLIFTENGTFKISDALFGTVRFNSSDVYGRIREGHTYTITYYGWRIPAFSAYPNIKTIVEVP